MKKIFGMIMVALTLGALSIGCEVDPAPGDTGPTGCRFINLASISHLRVVAYCTDDGIMWMQCDLIPNHEYNTKWREENNIGELEKYTRSQWESHVGRELRPEESCEFMYGKLTNIVITSDIQIGNIAAGENLMGLFYHVCSPYDPTCTYPDAELHFVNETTDDNPIEEYINEPHYCDRYLALTAKIDDGKDLPSAKFNITLTLTDGSKEYEFSEEFHFKH